MTTLVTRTQLRQRAVLRESIGKRIGELEWEQTRTRRWLDSPEARTASRELWRYNRQYLDIVESSLRTNRRMLTAVVD